MAQHGNLSINSENIFPIIKKWMYSDQDIFFRELISNCCDAITKLNKLALIGEYEAPADYKGRVDVIVNPEAKTIQFIDNGLGMTADEVNEYINQIAFSGATDFIEKYKDKATDDQIIGHFGLGFYSAFMVADKVVIDTLSYKKDAKPVHWECDGGTEYTLEDGTRGTVGTTITLHVNADCMKYTNEWEARNVIDKYCSFMPVEIYLSKEPKDTQTIDADEKKDGDVVLETIPAHKDGEREVKEQLKIEKRPELMNDTHPLWAKTPSECTKEEYIDFYHKVFHDYKEPLFWIHLNMDYPFNLKGILYFPKINTEYEAIEGTIKLYNNQVFIADNIKEVIPEFLFLLKGAIDCPDLPLNVSRSALQNDGFVKKISDYITKKVADKLSGMCKTDKENYEKYWDDIAPFIKYGCLRDDKFCKKMTDYILFKDINGKYMTLPECLEVNKTDVEESAENQAGNQTAAAEKSEGTDAQNTAEKSADADAKTTDADAAKAEEKKDKTIYYVTDPVQQSQYVNMFKDAGKDAVILPEKIDQPFINQLEAKNEGIHFKRIDADLQDAFKEETSEEAQKELDAKAETLEKTIRAAVGNDKLKIKLERMSSAKTAAMLTISEESRRMQDMMKMYAMQGMPMGDMPVDETLILNASHPLVAYVLDHEDGDTAKLISEQLYDLAKLQQAPLSSDEMARFIQRSNDIMLTMAK